MSEVIKYLPHHIHLYHPSSYIQESKHLSILDFSHPRSDVPSPNWTTLPSTSTSGSVTDDVNYMNALRTFHVEELGDDDDQRNRVRFLLDKLLPRE